MSAAELGLAASVFLASAVECVEALTIVLAVGVSRSWPAALAGVSAALLLLVVLILGLGTGLDALPLDAVRVFVGALLLAFGLKWRRKAVWREAGLKARRDEDAAYAAELDAAAEAASRAGGWDAYSFVIAF